MPHSDGHVFNLGPLSILRAGRLWNVELFGLVHLYGVGWCPWGVGLVARP